MGKNERRGAAQEEREREKEREREERKYRSTSVLRERDSLTCYRFTWLLETFARSGQHKTISE